MPSSTQPSVRRSRAVDSLRGLALLGILFINAPHFAGPWGYLPHNHFSDIVVEGLLFTFVAGKLYPVFAFLFGVGLGVAAAREEPYLKDEAFPTRLRLIYLCMLGCAHFFFLFDGDILLVYGVCGLVAWSLRKRSPARLLRFARNFLIAGLILQSFTMGVIPYVLDFPLVIPGEGYLGSYWDTTAERTSDFLITWLSTLAFHGSLSYAAILAGMVIFRLGHFILPHPSETSIPVHKRESAEILLQRWRFITPFRAGLVGVVLCAIATYSIYSADNLQRYTVGLVLWPGGSILLAYSWATFVLKWLRRHSHSRITHAFAPLGACSLSAYLLHSFLFGAVFHVW